MESQTDLEKNWTDLQKNLKNYRFTDQMDRFTEKFLQEQKKQFFAETPKANKKFAFHRNLKDGSNKNF